MNKNTEVFDPVKFSEECFKHNFCNDDRDYHYLYSKYFVGFQHSIFPNRSEMHQYLLDSPELLEKYDEHFAEITEAFPYYIYREIVSSFLEYDYAMVHYPEYDISIKTIDLPFRIGFPVKPDMSDFLDNFRSALDKFDISGETMKYVDSNGHGIEGVPFREIKEVIAGLEDFKDTVEDAYENIADIIQSHDKAIRSPYSFESMSSRLADTFRKLESEYPIVYDGNPVRLVNDAVSSIAHWKNGNTVTLRNLMTEVLYANGVKSGTEEEYLSAVRKLEKNYPAREMQNGVYAADQKKADEMVENLLSDVNLTPEQFVRAFAVPCHDVSFSNAFLGSWWDRAVLNASSLVFGNLDSEAIVSLFEDSGVYKDLSHDREEPFFRDLEKFAPEHLAEFISGYLERKGLLTRELREYVVSHADLSFQGSDSPLDYNDITDVALFCNYINKIMKPFLPDDRITMQDAKVILEYDANIDDVPDQFIIKNGVLMIHEGLPESADPQRDYERQPFVPYASGKYKNSDVLEEIFSRTHDLCDGATDRSVVNSARHLEQLEGYLRQYRSNGKKRADRSEGGREL